MEIIFGLLLLLLVTRAFSVGVVRLGLPTSVGELLAGAFLGALIFGFGGLVPDFERIVRTDELALIAQAGIFFLVLQAGIDMKPMDIARASRASLFVAVGGAAVPLVAGFVLGLYLFPESDLKLAQSFFVGVVLSITSIPATVKVLRDQGALTTRMGQTIIAAAIFDDILGLFLLALLTTLIKSGAVPDFWEFVILTAKVGLFFGLTVPLGTHVYPQLHVRLKALQLASVEFSTLMVVGLAYGLLAEVLGLHWIIGAFMAGIFFEPERVGVRAYNEIRIVVVGITGSVLGPLFFVSIGLAINIPALSAAPFLVFALLAIAFSGKFIGAGLPALFSGFSRRESAAVGTGMGARGAVELVVISIAIEAGLFASNGETIISALIATTLLATILTSVLLRAILGKS